MTAGMPDDDPGWGKPHEILLGLVPGVMARRAARSSSPLAMLRSVFSSFVLALVLYGVVLVFIDLGGASDEPPGVSTGSAVAGVALIGVVLVALSARIGGAPTCGTPAELVGRYRTRFFLRVACAEAAALVGFVASFLCENVVAYFVGMALALVGFAWLAPTRAHLQREDEHLRAINCPASLYAALSGRPQ